MSTPFSPLVSGFAFLPQRDIDTDQILPARFMSTTSSQGLGSALFFDSRHDARGNPDPDHVLNSVDVGSHQILVAGANFGCGSSREHAVWALHEFGIRAVIAPKVADIFKANALNNGVLIVEVSSELFEWLGEHRSAEVSLDLDRQIIQLPGWEPCRFQVDPFARHCLLNGTDRLGYLLDLLPEIKVFEAGKGNGTATPR